MVVRIGEVNRANWRVCNDMGADGQVTSPTERLRASIRDRGWSPAELAWVLGYSRETTENLVQLLHSTPTLALRLEAALDVPTEVWLADAATQPLDLWMLGEQHMAAELAGIRRRRHLLSQRERPGIGRASDEARCSGPHQVTR
jgi:plasmid maintenance system antidote protein VapI